MIDLIIWLQVTKDEQIKNSNHEQMKIIDAAKISLNGELNLIYLQ